MGVQTSLLSRAECNPRQNYFHFGHTSIWHVCKAQVLRLPAGPLPRTKLELARLPNRSVGGVMFGICLVRSVRNSSMKDLWVKGLQDDMDGTHAYLNPLDERNQSFAFLRPCSYLNQARPGAISSTGRRNYSQYTDRNTVGAFTPKSAALFVAVGVGLFFYFQHEKEKLLEEREKERAAKQYGRPQVGGPFNLTSHTGEPFTDKDLLGRWSLVYFGFTNCPDICPTELDKVSDVLNVAEKEYGNIFRPVFISVDPARDTPSRIARYLEDFHPSFVGVVGPWEATKAVCKAYRVYFSTPPNADPAGDYLVDHSIFVYLMDPQGNFMEAFGQSVPASDIISKVREVIAEWEQEHGKKVRFVAYKISLIQNNSPFTIVIRKPSFVLFMTGNVRPTPDALTLPPRQSNPEKYLDVVWEPINVFWQWEASKS
ncbi:SCO1-SenC-domain-containing protein [Pluteus cervinus]|uniref:SCO1-SenC-domain-containing protein n=1 Tax=Pluteus cervinus TaxID=181527 RepID=A0ACD3AGB8_9AGAR|nr:SCO1-SenC-domain-containing protein [Pluteus cervinus]